MSISEFIDNTSDNVEELGLFKFAKHFFPERFYNKFSRLHNEMATLLFMLLDPNRTRAIERQAYFLVHREAAKTSIATFLFPMYLIALKGQTIAVNSRRLKRDGAATIIPIRIHEDFIVIASETASSSEDFVNNLRTTLEENREIMEMFGEKVPQMLKLDDDRIGDKMWRRSAFITADRTVVRGIGAGQQIRGRLIGGHRPSFLIIDDMYSENNVKTEERREGLKKWFFNAAVNSLNSERGKTLWLGTMVHPDTVVRHFRKSDQWFGMERPIIGSEELDDAVKYFGGRGMFTEDGWFNDPRNNADILKWEEKLTTLSWPERHTLRYILMRFKEKRTENDLAYFYQEYMNEATDPYSRMVEREAFVAPRDFHIYRESGKQMCQFTHEGLPWKGELILSVGVDPASSVANTADDTAIVVAGYTRVWPVVAGEDDMTTRSRYPDGVIYPVIAHVEGGRYAIHPYQHMKGLAESLIAIDKRYKIDKLKIECNAQQEQIVREVHSTFQRLNMSSKIWKEISVQRKEDRILSILLPVIQKYDTVICTDTIYIDKIYNQLLMIGIADHDDYADALAIAFKEARIPAVPVEEFRGEVKPRYSEAESFGRLDDWLFL